MTTAWDHPLRASARLPAAMILESHHPDPPSEQRTESTSRNALVEVGHDGLETELHPIRRQPTPMGAHSSMARHGRSPETLVGRQAEQAELDRLLSAARAGTGGALVLVGEPGIGKTVLLRYAADRATGFRVLSCRGVPGETELAFAGLHEMLWPVIDRLDGLPGEQAVALRGALGLGAARGNRMLIGVAVLTLLSELAEQQPLLVVVDDLPLLDAPSRNCLTFVARRTAADPILMLFATHPGAAGSAPGTLPTRIVAGLDEDSAKQLVAQDNPGLSPLRTRRLIDLTAGNPLALRELGRTAVGSLGPAADPRLALGPRLRAAFDAELARLTAVQRTALLVAAAADGADAVVVQQAAQLVGVSAVDWLAAEDSGLMRIADGRIVVRHPLIRAAAYEAATPDERRVAHAALAEVFAARDPDRRAWHLAAAAEQPDEEIAAMLDAVAERAWARGGSTSAAQTLRRAAGLSPDAGAAAVRLSRAARAAWDSGDVETARELLSAADGRADAGVVAAAGGGLAGLLELGQGNPARAQQVLRADAERVDPRFRREIQHAELRAEWATGASLTDRQNDELAARDRDSGAELPPWLLPMLDMVLALGTETHALQLFTSGIERMRADGPISWLGYTLGQRAILNFVLGRWDDATTDAAEALRLAPDFTGRKTVADSQVALGFIAAMRGEETIATEYTAQTLAFSQPRHYLPVTAMAQWCRALSELTAERPDRAYELLDRIATPGDSAHHPTLAVLSAADAIEAAVRSGRADRAQRHLTLLRDHVERTGAAWAAADLACGRAQSASGTVAGNHFAEALDLVPVSRPLATARIRLLYGEWLRRARRRKDAQEQLRSAQRIFEQVDAGPWAARAARELAMTGERPTGEPVGGTPAAPLTAQELQVAKMAATGLTNREIAARLLISPRTVGHHLSNVFPKLGLARREELAKVDFEHGFRLTP
ncbi:helix-turn-helix transcriptional regulator [Nocardia sp. NPDC059240]|uniref:helix-turn-helix transcriptional regulator n=1 Tax=Nocardia sp. NPDC059240 TaxID=3346786 RepID=UPI0036BB25E9